MSSATSLGARLGDVCVLGLGKTGFAVASYLAGLMPQRVSSLTLYGGASSGEGEPARSLAERGVRVVLGSEDVRGRFDLAVASPGIPERSAFFSAARACSTEVIGEPEFAWRESPDRWVAITGTNGKTTTTSLVTAMLRSAGTDAVSVGNIGRLCTDELVRRRDGAWFVAELSSFQLATSRLLHPRCAALLNVTPDHLEWHGSLEGYAAAKERIFQNLSGDDLAVVSQEDGYCRDVIGRLEARGVRTLHVGVREEPVSGEAAFVRDGWLTVRLDGGERRVAPMANLPLRGEHNAQNMLAASSMALFLGASVEAVRRALEGFHPIEHRIEPVGEFAGVRFVNDSKATNTDSVEKALTAFDRGRIVVLLGGHDKGTDLGSLARAVNERCKAAVCFGAAGERIARAVREAGGPTQVIRAPHLREAFLAAVSAARPGDVVLLSPACSSFDEFHDMGERGRLFKGLVADLSANGGVR